MTSHPTAAAGCPKERSGVKCSHRIVSKAARVSSLALTLLATRPARWSETSKVKVYKSVYFLDNVLTYQWPWVEVA